MRRPHRRRRADRGSVAVEALVVLPLVILVAMFALQVAVREHARDVARTAARIAVDRARVLDGTAADGQTTADQFLSDGSDGLVDPEVAVHQGADQVTATVTGDVLSLTPLWSPSISVTVTADRERWVP